MTGCRACAGTEASREPFRGLGWEEMPAPGVEAEPSEQGWAVSWLFSHTDAPHSFGHLGGVSPRKELGMI